MKVAAQPKAEQPKTQLVEAHPLQSQVNSLSEQLVHEKFKLQVLEIDKCEINKAHAFLVGQNPNTPAGPKCMRLLEHVENLLKNQTNMISNLQNMIDNCKSQLQFEFASAQIDHLAKKYEV